MLHNCLDRLFVCRLEQNTFSLKLINISKDRERSRTAKGKKGNENKQKMIKWQHFSVSSKND